MAGPIPGLQQQLPPSTLQQPGQSAAQIRPENRKPQDNKVQPKSAAAAGSHRSDSGSNGSIASNLQQILHTGTDRTQPRGSLLDITV